MTKEKRIESVKQRIQIMMVLDKLAPIVNIGLPYDPEFEKCWKEVREKRNELEIELKELEEDSAE